ncbi:ribosome maturation factor RimM [Sulfurivermis fontis]|uniref:ribosome maturation factor RimM n=1 Tax=Sulfurivermis fontis TaxID=1972068 RepID=UPI000FDC5B9D|nr:ribosome maturation factor RimM [Sulfurivermis fontis]
MVESGQGKPIVVGRIAGLFGVRGWVKVFSHTQPLDNILRYSPWLVLRDGQWLPMKPLAGRIHGKGIVAHLEGCDDRDAAAALVGSDIAIVRSQLPRAAADEVYWADLIGLKVVTLEGVELGVVDHLLETGANDVVVVRGERERLLPYVDQVIREVDLHGGLLRVDWDPEF